MYKSRYGLISANLGPVHDEVEKGAIFEAVSKGIFDPERIPYLNNHGRGHVATVIENASELLKVGECKITPYEGYLLLLAIQFHDVGVIFGRKDHQLHCAAIMNSLGGNPIWDHTEKKVIFTIASAHAGLLSDGSTEDTISLLEAEPIDLMGQSIRNRLLAAILRLSDELADDYRRTSKTIIDLQRVRGESKIYHIYSSCLNSVMIEKSEIRLSYDFEESNALEEYPKANGSTVFLIDEIYARTLKMHSELVYCMRFMRPDFQINRIKVTISIHPPNPLIPPMNFGYTLQETGYPTYHCGSIYELCPNLVTGVQIKDQILQQRGNAQ